MLVVELRSASDELRPLQDKMNEYRDNGVRLGWLIDPQQHRVEIYQTWAGRGGVAVSYCPIGGGGVAWVCVGFETDSSL